jgi:hypothetical protein
MKRELRVSSMKDYIALDIVDEKVNGKPIQSTPLYLAKGKPVLVERYHEFSNNWFKTRLLFDGETIHIEDIDSKSLGIGLTSTLNPEELLDPKQFKF